MKSLLTIIISAVLISLSFADTLKGETVQNTDIRIAENVIEAVKDIDIVSLNVLLAEDASVDTVDEAGNTPLMHAAKIGNPRMSRIILVHDPVIDARNNEGETALMIAARYGAFHIVEQLLNKGADTSLKNSESLTARDIALRNGHPDILNLLSSSSEETYSFSR